MLLRRTVQFHWQNDGYADFDDFLVAHDARTGARTSARSAAACARRASRSAGCAAPRSSGRHWEFFERCYRRTYAAHRSSPYLNLEFFLRLGATLPRHTLLILAERAGKPVAATLNIVTENRIFGRYWGAVEHVPLLHFECCYYQAIEFAIAHRLQVFEGGAQGEHKLFRGLLPVETLLGALARAPALRARHRGLPGARERRHRALCGRTKRAFAIQGRCIFLKRATPSRISFFAAAAPTQPRTFTHLPRSRSL